MTNEELELAQAELWDLLRHIPDAFIGGSYIVNKEAANDIDVVIPEWSVRNDTLEVNGFERTDNTLYESCPELVSTWRKGSINALVITNAFVPAYMGAVERMREEPTKYATKGARVELHERYSKQIMEMITPK